MATMYLVSMLSRCTKDKFVSSWWAIYTSYTLHVEYAIDHASPLNTTDSMAARFAIESRNSHGMLGSRPLASHSKAGRHFWAGSAAPQLQEDTCQCKDLLKSEAYFLSFSGCQENKDPEKLFAWGFNIPGALQGRFCKGVEEGSSQVLVSADPYWRVLIDLWNGSHSGEGQRESCPALRGFLGTKTPHKFSWS